MTDEERRSRYVDEVGHEPNDPPPEYAWQWAYRGRDDEQELLLELLQNEAESQAEQLSLL
jgi:hypothetical protein